MFQIKRKLTLKVWCRPNADAKNGGEAKNKKVSRPDRVGELPEDELRREEFMEKMRMMLKEI